MELHPPACQQASIFTPYLLQGLQNLNHPREKYNIELAFMSGESVAEPNVGRFADPKEMACPSPPTD